MHPELPLGISTYGLTLFFSFLVGYFSALRFARQRSIPVQHIENLMLMIVVCAPIGAKLWSVASDGGNADWRYGFSSTGGVAASLFCLVVYTRWRSVSLFKLLEILIPAFLLAFGTARIGCFLGGCCPHRIYETAIAFGLYLAWAGIQTRARSLNA